MEARDPIRPRISLCIGEGPEVARHGNQEKETMKLSSKLDRDRLQFSTSI
jgi:hypothetical protein